MCVCVWGPSHPHPFTCAQKFVLCFVNFFLAANLFSFTFLHCPGQRHTHHPPSPFYPIPAGVCVCVCAGGFENNALVSVHWKLVKNDANEEAEPCGGRRRTSPSPSQRHLKPHTRALKSKPPFQLFGRGASLAPRIPGSLADAQLFIFIILTIIACGSLLWSAATDAGRLFESC